ncbi:MAG: ABC transporter ATP-binding protein [Oscillospiraceae bacterium]|nr:ABC transporter ATP-binding protein [Oscillospiraceae bacterium]
MELLKIENLCKTYGKGENEVRALDDISFIVPKGQMAAIIGPSGSGKSTLLHILGGVDRPTSGKVFLDGQDVYKQNNHNLAVFRRRQVGLIYQFYNLIPVLNAEENITLPMIMDGRTPKLEQLYDMLKMLDLVERRHHLPSQLSGGQQQRVSIGRALFNSPGVILADEPTGNLDSKNSAEIIALLRKSNREMDQTMLIITHDENIALQCDRIITLSDGKIVSDKLTGQSGMLDDRRQDDV